MTDPERQALLETAVAGYYRGAIEILDLLEKAVGDMPDLSEKLPISDFLAAIAMARALVIEKSQNKDFDPEAPIKYQTGDQN